MCRYHRIILVLIVLVASISSGCTKSIDSKTNSSSTYNSSIEVVSTDIMTASNSTTHTITTDISASEMNTTDPAVSTNDDAAIDESDNYVGNNIEQQGLQVIRGNTDGNLGNEGRMAFDSHYGYFFEGADLYRISLDDNNKEIIGSCDDETGDFWKLNKVQDSIYFKNGAPIDGVIPSAVFKWTKEGGAKKIEGLDYILSYLVVGNVIYYIKDYFFETGEISDSLFCAVIDGYGLKDIKELDRGTYIDSILLDDKSMYLYYNNGDDVYKVRCDGSESPILIKHNADFVDSGWGSFDWFIDGNTIYYRGRENKGVYCMDLEGNNEKKICDQYGNINLCGEYIVFGDFSENGHRKLLKIKKDGTEPPEIFLDESAIMTQVIGKDIYYWDAAFPSASLCKTDIDGTYKIEVKKPSDIEEMTEE